MKSVSWHELECYNERTGADLLLCRRFCVYVRTPEERHNEWLATLIWWFAPMHACIDVCMDVCMQQVGVDPMALFNCRHVVLFCICAWLMYVYFMQGHESCGLRTCCWGYMPAYMHTVCVYMHTYIYMFTSMKIDHVYVHALYYMSKYIQILARGHACDTYRTYIQTIHSGACIWYIQNIRTNDTLIQIIDA
jgi:hypothetical protein